MYEEIVPYQLELRQELPEIIGNIDYTIFRETLIRIEELINQMKLDHIVIKYEMQRAWENRVKQANKKGKSPKPLSKKERIKIQKKSRIALRCVIARHLTGEPYRDFSCRLADSALFQYFCEINKLDKIKVPSKSTLQRYERMVPEEIVRQLVATATKKASSSSIKVLNETLSISFDSVYYDTTCVKTNIHFPVDWVLLRDVVRTLMKAVNLIRSAGLKNRMNDPKEFIKKMNKLSMQMTYTRRKRGARKRRKKIFRLMKKLVRKVTGHAEKHIALLQKYWHETNLSEGQKNQIAQRMEGVLEKLPDAIHQAHERIIGERKVESKDKLLSLYEPDTNVIVRGKASAEVEFGNKLLLAELGTGIIVDWKLYQKGSPADNQLLQESIERIQGDYGEEGKPKCVTGDRGFFSPKNRKYLNAAGIEDCVCPRSVKELAERLDDENFCTHHHRRAQTEGRIAILKNNFLGKPLKSKGFVSRELHVAWGILAHNLWLLARLSINNIFQQRLVA